MQVSVSIDSPDACPDHEEMYIKQVVDVVPTDWRHVFIRLVEPEKPVGRVFHVGNPWNYERPIDRFLESSNLPLQISDKIGYTEVKAYRLSSSRSE